jgi:CRISPR system Cascade subunit CasA
MNLIRDHWIPVLRQSGARLLIAPWQLTDAHANDPIVALDSERPDFNGALIQFLIGLVQTAAAPEDKYEWQDWFREPPAPEALRERFDSIAHAFELFGDGPRFMQDYNLQDGEEKSVAGLLIDAPGANALRNNSDHFVKRGHVHALCAACCAAALFTLQTNAPAGGAGNRTSLRGGGPLTTLVLETPGADGEDFQASLWRAVWLNVLERPSFLGHCGNPDRDNDSDRFPWLAPARTSEPGTGRDTTPGDVHPDQLFWATPRRIRLNADRLEPGRCDLCGADSPERVTGYRAKNHGANYKGPWLHPLSPYLRDKQQIPQAIHPQPGGMSYRHWLGLVQSQRDKNGQREPALVVHTFLESGLRRPPGQFRLWAFGYDMDNMKARCWYESIMPLYYMPDTERQAAYADIVREMVRAASEVASNLKQAVKRALFGRVKASSRLGATDWRVSPVAKDDSSLLADLTNAFWHNTEPEFFAALARLREALLQGGDDQPIREGWHRSLCRYALRLFDDWVQRAPIEDGNPKRVVLAREELRLFNHGKKIKTEILRLPVPQDREDKTWQTANI